MRTSPLPFLSTKVPKGIPKVLATDFHLCPRSSFHTSIRPECEPLFPSVFYDAPIAFPGAALELTDVAQDSCQRHLFVVVIGTTLQWRPFSLVTGGVSHGHRQ